jgi:glycosyltransferase involved in cell wall biosynthesis
LAAVPVVVHTYHGHLLHSYFSTAATHAVVAVERVLARVTTALVAVGSRVRDDLLQVGIGSPGQYTVVPPGVSLPPAPSMAAARQQLGLNAGGEVVAFVARLTAVKRPDRFLEVARRLAADRPRLSFVVAGEGDLFDELRRSAASLGDRVRFLGWRRDVETVYAAADLVVLTSDNEGTPVSLIEAATVGCPAVATDIGSVREVVDDGKTGVLVPRDSHALAAAINRLLDDRPLLTGMRTAATDRALRLYSRDRLIADTAALYERLAGRA